MVQFQKQLIKQNMQLLSPHDPTLLTSLGYMIFLQVSYIYLQGSGSGELRFEKCPSIWFYLNHIYKTPLVIQICRYCHLHTICLYFSSDIVNNNIVMFEAREGGVSDICTCHQFTLTLGQRFRVINCKHFFLLLMFACI